MSAPNTKLTFFRETGWMVIATTLSGAFMLAMHLFARKLTIDEYGVVTTLLQIVNLMSIPAIGLQTVFAQQAAVALSESRQRQLRNTVRTVLLATFLIWMAMAAGIFVFRHGVLSTLKITYAASLWITVLIGLAQLWLPIANGLLQGRQNFMWLGWAAIFNGVGRFAVVGLIVTVVGGTAAGVMTGVLLGMVVALGCAVWQTHPLWRGASEPFSKRGWLARVVPLTFGLGASLFMLSADMIFVQSLFDKDQTGLYGAAGMIGRALVFFTGPMTAVMFPKIVESAARAEKTNVLAQALGATALLGGLGAVLLTLFPKLPLMLIQGKAYIEIAYLIPWFAWCFLPLTLANVLINNLLARERFAAVPWLFVIAAGYGAALCFFNTTFLQIVQTLGVFSLLMLAVAAWFTWGAKVPNSRFQVPS